MKTVLAALVVAATLCVASPAHAEDHRPCVSTREMDHAGVNTGRTHLERTWDVQGDGRRVRMADLPMQPVVVGGDRFIRYPLCGYSEDEGGVVVMYTLDRQWFSMFRWVIPGSTLHGHR